jgi:anti-anti-sigma factor
LCPVQPRATFLGGGIGVVEVCGGDAALVLRPFGELCHFQLDPLRAAIHAALACEPREVRVDLAETRFVSSSAVGLFLEADVACHARGVRFVLTGVHGINRRVLEALDAADLIEQDVPLAAL